MEAMLSTLVGTFHLPFPSRNWWLLAMIWYNIVVPNLILVRSSQNSFFKCCFSCRHSFCSCFSLKLPPPKYYSMIVKYVLGIWFADERFNGRRGVLRWCLCYYKLWQSTYYVIMLVKFTQCLPKLQYCLASKSACNICTWKYVETWERMAAFLTPSALWL